MSEEKQNNNPEEISEIELLQASIKQMQEQIKKLNEQEKPKFFTAPLNNASIPEKAKPKENEAVNGDIKFNGLEVFWRQFADTSKMLKWRQNCEILTMRVNPDPRYPEWQVS